MKAAEAFFSPLLLLLLPPPPPPLDSGSTCTTLAKGSLTIGARASSGSNTSDFDPRRSLPATRPQTAAAPPPSAIWAGQGAAEATQSST